MNQSKLFQPFWLALAGILALLSAPVLAQSGGDKVGFTTLSYAGRLPALAARADKEFLIYQFRINYQASKEPLLATVQEFDQVMTLLRRGSPISGVAKPPNKEVRDALSEVEGVWKDLKRVYTFNSVQVRRAKDLLPPPERLRDPFLVHFVDDMSAQLIESLDGLFKLYQAACPAECVAAGTELIRQQYTLSETMTKDVLFIVLGLQEGDHEESLTLARNGFERTLMQMGRDAGADLAASVEATTGTWRQFRTNVDMALGGDVDAVDVSFLLRIQERMIENIDESAQFFATPTGE
ncbi:MAG: type IV pili methyl-accepting chemotaxis transducer N-terminal domain-containing protein [Xanthomonadales bacterium]|nr:type IV pili methyl-accepting chemotaxis transducer N-terminal domain-containing protein [Xanthomonadales bacterium]